MNKDTFGVQLSKLWDSFMVKLSSAMEKARGMRELLLWCNVLAGYDLHCVSSRGTVIVLPFLIWKTMLLSAMTVA